MPLTFSTCLWFDRQAEEAATFYISIFPRSRIRRVTRYGEAGYEVHGRKAGTVLTVEFELDGHAFIALNGGPLFTFNQAVSIVVNCKTQREINRYWARLSKGGPRNAQQCGWLKDKFGLSWQVVPAVLDAMIGDPNPARAGRVMEALLKMRKLDLRKLRKAAG
jgi:predicted 3-demethylubiquinone-9 3-methyltransferase (glyoxalase superfamily)